MEYSEGEFTLILVVTVVSCWVMQRLKKIESKIMQDGNIKLSTYVSDVFCVSGRALLESIINGDVLRPHHRKLIQMHYDHLIYIESQITELETEIDQLVTPYREEMYLLMTIPGIKKDAAAEIGIDMSKFPSDGHISSWGGLSPGKKKGYKSTKGNKGLKAVLCQVAWAPMKTKNSRLSSFVIKKPPHKLYRHQPI